MSKKTFNRKLIEQLNKTKERAAIVKGNIVINYQELHKKSDFITNWIIANGYHKGSCIGIQSENIINMIFFQVGIIKAGCSFCFIDLKNNSTIIGEIIKGADIKLVIGEEENINKIDPAFIQKNNIIKFEAITHILNNYKGQNDTYGTNIEFNEEDIVFKSNTYLNGKIQTLSYNSKSIKHLIEWNIDFLCINKGARLGLLNKSDVSFSFMDIFISLLSEGTIYIPENDELFRDKKLIIDWLHNNRINVISLLPKQFHMMASANIEDEKLNDLKYIILYGNNVQIEGIEQWVKSHKEKFQIIRMYGYNETTFTKAYSRIQSSHTNNGYLSGLFSSKGARIIILDEDMKLCEKLKTGNIYIRTPYLASRNSNDQYNYNFVKNPFQQSENELIFKTQERGRIKNDGSIEIMKSIKNTLEFGRIRFFSDEVSDIIKEHPDVDDAEVFDAKDFWNPSLSANISLKTEKTDTNNINKNLRKYLSQRLPNHLIPRQFIFNKNIPGKTDDGMESSESHNAGDTDRDAQQATPADDQSVNPMEEELIKICRELFNKDIKADDEFMNIGVTSLNIISLIVKILKIYNIRLSLEDIFSNSSVSKLSALITSKRTQDSTLQSILQEIK